MHQWPQEPTLFETGVKAFDLKSIFGEIRDYFAGNVTGITRDEQIAQNLMRLLFCKLYSESIVSEKRFKTTKSLSQNDSNLKSLFEDVKKGYSDVFDKNETIDLSGKDLKFVVELLEHFELLSAERDVIADAFEELIGRAFRGGEGQFFTPRNVVQMMVEVLDPKSHEKVIDPACGSGGFLAATALYMNKNYSGGVFGIDKDAFLVKIARTYLTVITNMKANIYCENSLEVTNQWGKVTQLEVPLKGFDVVLTNPPFGAKIPVVGRELLGQYDLAKVYDYERDEPSEQLMDRQPPQVLFIERCLQLLKPGGRMGIVLPEGIFGNPSDKYIWKYLERNAHIFGIVSLAQETFQPSTHTKTSVLFVNKERRKISSNIYMGIAEKIGHNKNGKLIYKQLPDGTNKLDDDIPELTANFREFLQKNKFKVTNKSFTISSSKIHDGIYIPAYYDPGLEKELKNLESSNYKLMSIGQLVRDGILEIRRGNEIGSENYGTGDIPFVRTSDIVNWEIKADPIKCISEEVYKLYEKNQDVQPSDILFVSDGTFLIGRSAMVGVDDCKMLIQSHVKKIRVLQREVIDPYYLFYLLNSSLFKRQVVSKTFIQATISTLGSRIFEIVLPLSSDLNERAKYASEVKKIMQLKSDTRQLIRTLTQDH